MPRTGVLRALASRWIGVTIPRPEQSSRAGFVEKPRGRSSGSGLFRLGFAGPVQPLIEGAQRPSAMFKDYWKYDWVLPVHRYEGLEPLLAGMAEKVIGPAEAKVKALEDRQRAIEAELTKPS